MSARLVQTADGRSVLQMRVELGVLQMEASGRPDGQRPHGFPTYLQYLQSRQAWDEEGALLDEVQCGEIDRECVQYYHRRVCWLALREYGHAIEDADHTLALMDYAAEHSPNHEWTLSHEQHRPFVLFHRTQAAALAALEQSSPAAAIEQVEIGLERMRRVYEGVDAEEEFDDDEMVQQLVELRQWMRTHYRVGRTLQEQLDEAVAREQYELAAWLRDEIARHSHCAALVSGDPVWALGRLQERTSRTRHWGGRNCKPL